MDIGRLVGIELNGMEWNVNLIKLHQRRKQHNNHFLNETKTENKTQWQMNFFSL